MMIYFRNCPTTGCHWLDRFALRPSCAAAPDAHWMAEAEGCSGLCSRSSSWSSCDLSVLTRHLLSDSLLPEQKCQQPYGGRRLRDGYFTIDFFFFFHLVDTGSSTYWSCARVQHCCHFHTLWQIQFEWDIYSFRFDWPLNCIKCSVWKSTFFNSLWIAFGWFWLSAGCATGSGFCVLLCNISLINRLNIQYHFLTVLYQFELFSLFTSDLYHVNDKSEQ